MPTNFPRLICLLAGMTVFTHVSAVPLDAGIIPAPTKCEVGAGTFTLSVRTTIVWRGSATQKLAQRLREGMGD